MREDVGKGVGGGVGGGVASPGIAGRTGAVAGGRVYCGAGAGT